MSDILIKGMKMPKSCDKCPCIDKETNPSFTVCGVNKKIIPFEWSRKPDVFEVIHPKPKHCPLIEVPKHGRLIDADALEDYCHRQTKNKWNESTQTSWAYAYASFESDVEDAPTIIPAEEGKR